MKTILLLSTTLILVINGCLRVPNKTIPKADIVYESLNEFDSKIKSKIKPKIGFVNQDGTGKVDFETDLYYDKPVCLDDGKTIYFLMWNGHGTEFGFLSYWKEKKRIHRCKTWHFVETFGGIIPDTEARQSVINNGRAQILIVDHQRCDELDILADVIDDRSNRLFGASLSSDGKKLLYSQESGRYSQNLEYSILVLDMDSKEIREIGSGINPAWSPDGSKIAYIQYDGIYVMNADGNQNKLIFDVYLHSRHAYQGFTHNPPYPRWSPDGEYLIYHRCPRGGTVCDIQEETIYKINIDTGEETKILEGGKYPYWCPD